MAYSASLADRVRQVLRGRREIVEKKMFGGMVYLLDGNMLVGIWHQSLIVRLGPDAAEAALKRDYVRPFDVTGRPMKNWIMVEPDGLENDRELGAWIDQALEFVETLPRK